jgi:hypothetical protein
MNEEHLAVTPTVVRTFPTTPNRGDLTVREVIDAYMATYSGSDHSRAARMEFRIQALGSLKLRDRDSDHIADALDQMAAQPVRKYIGEDAEGRRLYRDHHARSGKTVNRYRTWLIDEGQQGGHPRPSGDPSGADCRGPAPLASDAT